MFFSSILFDIFLALITLLVIVICYFKRIYSYWKRIGLYSLEDNYMNSLKMNKSFGQRTAEIYFEIKSKNVKHAGVYFLHLPIYIPIDPEIIKGILQKDFNHFTDHGIYYNEKDDPLTAHLFALEGSKWRNMRANLSPTFTSGKMKMMFPLMVETSTELRTILDKYHPNQAVEIKDVLARLTTDIIGTCVFGLDCNSLRDADSEFRKRTKRIFDITGKELALSFFTFMFPDLMRFFGAKILPDDVSKFFLGVMKDTINFRESNGIERNDFIQLLIQMKNKSDSKFTLEELSANAFVFFSAGFETSSTTMALCLVELSQNPDIQEKLRDEINNIMQKQGDEFTYEGMMEMHYMDMVINETLRKYPPLPTIIRVCTRTYKIPDTDIILEKGTKVFISVEGLHHDPEYFENPEIFNPERFADRNKQNRYPFTFLPFGEGPRTCIGSRFGIMQIKVALTILLKHYKFKLNVQTQLPLKVDPRNFVATILDGIWMNVEKIST